MSAGVSYFLFSIYFSDSNDHDLNMLLLYGLVTLINFIFYVSINWYVKEKANNKQNLKNASDRQIWIWNNTLCSLIHAIIAGLWAVAW